MAYFYLLNIQAFFFPIFKFAFSEYQVLWEDLSAKTQQISLRAAKPCRSLFDSWFFLAHKLASQHISRAFIPEILDVVSEILTTALNIRSLITFTECQNVKICRFLMWIIFSMHCQSKAALEVLLIYLTNYVPKRCVWVLPFHYKKI